MRLTGRNGDNSGGCGSIDDNLGVGDLKVVRGDLAVSELNINDVGTGRQLATREVGARDDVRLAIERSSAAGDVAKVARAGDLDGTELSGVAVLGADVETEFLLVVGAVVDLILSLEEDIAVWERAGG